MNYEQALEYIHGVSWEFCKPGLSRIGQLCEKLGNPQGELQFIHVAGTNGKGSFCSMLDSVLRAANIKTGLYTSPYIKFFNERMCVNGVPISNEELAEITSYVRPIADEMKDKPTEFELITAIAFEYFKRNGVNVVILEAGMGGRLDSTNIISTSVLSVITGIALDHTAFLGDTVEKIAAEKAGIIKPQTDILYGGEDAAALQVIKSKAIQMSAPFHLTDLSSLKIKKADLRSTVFDYEEYENLSIRLLGAYQPKNAANVLSAVKILKNKGFDIPESAVREGLASAVWHARFELLSTEPTIIYDGAHNPEGISMFIRSIRQYFGEQKVIIVSTVMGDKDYESMVGLLSSVTDTAYVFKVNDRALECKKYAEVYEKHGTSAIECDDMQKALTLAIEHAKREGKPILCAGSLYMYGTLTNILQKLL